MRQIITLKDDWFFAKNKQEQIPQILPENWERVSLPHTWNCLDGQDGGSDYYRGACWYVRELQISELPSDTCIYIEFLAVASLCKVYVNGTQVTEHEGGYSSFRVDITAFLHKGLNLLSVMTDNQHYDHIYPQVADFTFYGGLYRDVRVLTVPKTHFCLDYYGSEGITACSEIKNGNQVQLSLHAYVSNAKETDQVLFSIYDQEGSLIAQTAQPAAADTYTEFFLSDVHLWQGVQSPYLYSIKAELYRHNEVLDQVTVRHGFREFHVDPEKGFYLNGILTPLRGVSRHQDFLGLGNALTLAHHEMDARLIKEVGANTIRLAHYQHSQDFYNLCDEMGFIVWAEIPFISRMSDTPDAHQNCILQMKELIYQNYNHSSICFWGISNEITIGANTPQLLANLKDLNALAKTLDSSRLTTMAQLSSLPMEDEQNCITDILSYNHYFGWYTGVLEDNEKWLDTFHQSYPQRALGISEYGCEGIISYHSDTPKAGDYSEEYQALYHEHMAKIIEERPWLWATHIWNMFDFGCDARKEGGVAGRNNKGLVTIDRQIKKDSFYLYKAYWNPEPMVHICSKRYGKRTDSAIDIKVYSNAPEISLYVNGAFFKKEQGQRVFLFRNIPLKEGFTTITAKSAFCCDTAVFEKVSEPFSAYQFVEDASETGVTNWFEHVDLNKERELTFREGYYSIHDTAREILENKEASDILVNALSSLIGYNLKKSMLAVMGDNRLCDTASALPAEEAQTEKAMAYINEKLQEIPK